MKKILLLLTIVSMLTTTLSAETTSQSHDKLVEEYLEVSGQGYAFKNIPTQMVNMIDQQFAASGEKAEPQVRAILIEGFTKESTVNNITANIEKISSENLTKLTTFYKTKVGQKCVRLNKEEDMDNAQAELPVFAQELQENPPSKHRIESMNTMFEETNILSGSLGMLESIIRIFNASAPKEKQMSSEQIEGLMTQMNQQMTQQLVITFYYALRNFSDKELDEVVQITLSPEGQAETDAQLADMSGYFTTVTNDLVAALKKH